MAFAVLLVSTVAVADWRLGDAALLAGVVFLVGLVADTLPGVSLVRGAVTAAGWVVRRLLAALLGGVVVVSILIAFTLASVVIPAGVAVALGEAAMLTLVVFVALPLALATAPGPEGVLTAVEEVESAGLGCVFDAAGDELLIVSGRETSVLNGTGSELGHALSESAGIMGIPCSRVGGSTNADGEGREKERRDVHCQND